MGCKKNLDEEEVLSLVLLFGLVFVLRMVFRGSVTGISHYLLVVSGGGNVDHRVEHQTREQETRCRRHTVDRGRREYGQCHAQNGFTPLGL